MFKKTKDDKKVSAKVILLSIPHSAALMGLFDLKEEESTWSTGTDLLLIFGGLAVFILAYLWFLTHDEEMANFLSGDDWFFKSKTRSIIVGLFTFFFIDCGVMILVMIPLGVLVLIGYGIYWLFS